jgi:dihydroorotate dehydrogenase
MPNLAYRLARSALFRLDAEWAHGLAMAALRCQQAVPPVRALYERSKRIDDGRLRQSLLGIEFPNPVGLAAGFDKEGRVVEGMASMGFGFLELGTVTPLGQPGNQKPRMFRIPEEQSLVNRLGFNNGGADELEARLRPLLPFRLPVGINLGKNKATPNEAALDDYRKLAARFGAMASYLVINVSSPNTPGLRDLQNESFVTAVLAAVLAETATPTLLKISPDAGPEASARLARCAIAAGAAGVIATNTTSDAAFLERYSARLHGGGGGVSGRHLCQLSFEIFDAVAAEIYGDGLLVSVGGISSGAEARRRLEAGASLVQLYSALVFEGPGVVRRINRELLEEIERLGLGGIGDLVGRAR